MRLRYQWLISIFLVFLLCLSTKLLIPDSLLGQKPINPDGLNSDFDPNPPQAFFNNLPISSPKTLIADNSILGDTTNDGPKHIEIDLSKQRLYAYEGDKLVYSFLISSGKWNRTPTGTFTIWTKIRSTKMEGGSKSLGSYYYLPNVPYVMFFSNDSVAKQVGYSIHGTYWHNNFGVPMSHGCINMKTEEVAILYQWAQPSLNGKSSMRATAENPGTPITIYGKYQY